MQYVGIEEPNNLLSVLRKLYKAGINRLLVEGGAFTINQFITASLWNEARVITCAKTLEKGVKAPQIVGKMENELQMIYDNIVYIRNVELKKF